MVIIALNAYRITMRPVCCGNIDMRAQAQEPSARRPDTPKEIWLLALRASVIPTDARNRIQAFLCVRSSYRAVVMTPEGVTGRCSRLE